MKMEVPFESQNEKSIEENLALFNRAKKLKERALELLKEEREDKDENINA